MNEQIEKLFDQALAEFTAENKYATVVVPDPIQRDFVEKFAELIVRECIDIISPYAIRMENFDGGHPIADLKKHFGVEE